MVCQAERLSFNILIALLPKGLAVLEQPNKRLGPTLLQRYSMHGSWGSTRCFPEEQRSISRKAAHPRAARPSEAEGYATTAAQC